MQADSAVAGARIVQAATYDDPKVQEQDAKVDGYYTLMREKEAAVRRRAPYPVSTVQVREAVAPSFYAAIIGDVTPRMRSTRRPPRPRPSCSSSATAKADAGRTGAGCGPRRFPAPDTSLRG